MFKKSLLRTLSPFLNKPQQFFFSISQTHHHDSKSHDDLYNRMKDGNQSFIPRHEIVEPILRKIISSQGAEFLSTFPSGFFSLNDLKTKYFSHLNDEEFDVCLKECLHMGLIFEVIFDDDEKVENKYVFPEPVVGWFEGFWMRDRTNEMPTKELAELFAEFMEEFVKTNATSRDFSQLRTCCYDQMMPKEHKVVDYKSAIKICQCSCRTKYNEMHPDKKIKIPQSSCFTLGNTSRGLAKNGLVKECTKEEMLDLLDQFRELGLVHNVQNVKENHAFVCNCDGEACLSLGAFRNYGVWGTVHSDFVATVDQTSCIGCGTCVKKCPMKLYSLEDQKAVLNNENCIGCGVCAYHCKEEAISMIKRDDGDEPLIFDDLIDIMFTSAVKRKRLHRLFPPEQKMKRRMVKLFENLGLFKIKFIANLAKNQKRAELNK